MKDNQITWLKMSHKNQGLISKHWLYYTHSLRKTHMKSYWILQHLFSYWLVFIRATEFLKDGGICNFKLSKILLIFLPQNLYQTISMQQKHSLVKQKTKEQFTSIGKRFLFFSHLLLLLSHQKKNCMLMHMI